MLKCRYFILCCKLILIPSYFKSVTSSLHIECPSLYDVESCSMEEVTDVSVGHNAPVFTVVDPDSCFLASQLLLTADLANASTLIMTALRLQKRP
jgi:hypothetical protein